MARAGYVIRKASPALYALAKQEYQSGFKDQAIKLLSVSQNEISNVLKAQAPEFLTLRAVDYTARSAFALSQNTLSWRTFVPGFSEWDDFKAAKTKCNPQ